VQNLVVIDAAVSIIRKFQYFAFGLKTPNHTKKLGF